jgi:hypothetical protein
MTQIKDYTEHTSGEFNDGDQFVLQTVGEVTKKTLWSTIKGFFLKPSEVVNDLVTGGSAVPLSAEQGKTLNNAKMGQYRFYQIDGDFNHWQAGDPGSVTSGYVSDIWGFSQSAGAGTFTRISSPTNSKEYALNIAMTTIISVPRIYQIQEGGIFSNKKMSAFIYAKVTSGTGDVSFRIAPTGGASATDSSIQTLTDSYAWYRLDNDRSSSDDSSATSSETQIFLRSAVEYQIDKIRITEQLPGSEGKEGDAGVVIPDWVKEDEDREAMLNKVLQYYYVWTTDDLNNNLTAVGWAVNASFIRLSFFLPVKMVDNGDGTIILNGTRDTDWELIDMDSGSATNSTGSFNSDKIDGNLGMFNFTPGTYTAGNKYTITSNNQTFSIEFDKRF